MKRPQTEEEEEPVTNDLEIAAAYAVAQYKAATPADDNEIIVDDDCDDNEAVIPNNSEETKESIPENIEKDGETGPAEEDNESDADSDLDLTEALQKMDAHTDEEIQGLSTTGAPKTIHEVDGYHGSVQQVEQVLGTSLNVDAVPRQQTQPAGHIQHFMTDERIMVVQSLGNSPLLLEEGNLLVLKEPSWIPLGKILEVFGPVSQPLYSIRLPEPVDKEQEDPWSPEGKYTNFVRQQPNLLVHYLPQVAKLVDTHSLLANRQRGCDASNVHDEEVQNAGEMDYSDDEAERQARRRKSRHRSGVVLPSQPIPMAQATTPGGFHAATLPTRAQAPARSQPQPEEESDTIYYD